MKKFTPWPLLVAAGCMALSSVAMAKVPASEANQLGKNLTCMGSVKAGSKDGLIPKWTGKWVGTPPGISYTEADAAAGKRYPNAYPNEKPLYIITNANLAKYEKHLSPGQKALFHKYKNYRMEIYPSHRDFRYPDYVCKLNKYNALHAVITDPQYGAIADAKQGTVPFPIAKNGIQMLMSSEIAMVVWSEKLTVDNVDVLPNGTQVWGRILNWNYNIETNPIMRGKPYTPDSIYDYTITSTLIPLRDRGNATLSSEPLNFKAQQRLAWTYNQGTRRMSQLPVFGFAQPLAGTDGSMTIDQDRIFNGSPERYNWKLLGSRELYMPADDYKVNEKSVTYKKLIGKHFPNPDYIRWELQRVYVVEGTLRPGYRHIYKKRVLYINQDSHQAEMGDFYDSRGALWRTGYVTNYWAYNAHVFAAGPEFYMDLQSGGYVGFSLTNERKHENILNVPGALKPSMFTPQALRAMSNS